MTSPATSQLIRFAAESGFEDLPDAVVRESKRCILDFLGVTIGALDTEAGRIARDTVLDLGGKPQCRILGFGDEASVIGAALVEGILSHVLDFDDTHLPTILHPTAPLMAAAFPLGEWRGASGRDLITAHILGFEVAARVARALYPEHYDAGWHMTGTAGTIGAAVAAGRLLGLGYQAMLNAVGIASSQAAGLRAQFGTMTKSLHVGNAARNGTLAALLASRGFTAAADPLEGRRGVFQVMNTRGDPDPLTRGLAHEWEIFHNGFKPYACGVVTHPGIDAVRGLRDDHGVRPDEVTAIELRVHPLVLELTGNPTPTTGLEGKFSLVFAAAMALIEGRVGPRQFTDEHVTRPDVVELRDRITLEPDPHLEHTEATAVVLLEDGRRIEHHVPAATGTPENPMSDAQLRGKFLDLVEPVLAEEAAQELIDLVERLDELGSVAPIVSATIR